MKEIIQTLEQKPQLKELMAESIETLDILKKKKRAKKKEKNV